MNSWPLGLSRLPAGPNLPLAACKGEPVELFFPPRGGHADEKALALCRRCPELEACKSFALGCSVESLKGIWAGTTELTRRKLRRGAKVTSPLSIEALGDLDEPTEEDLASLEEEAELEQEADLEAVDERAPVLCQVCGEALDDERLRRKAVTCHRSSCQAEHRRQLEHHRKARAARNGAVATNGAHANGKVPVPVSLEAVPVPTEPPLDAVRAWLATMPGAVRAVVLDGWQITRVSARAASDNRSCRDS